MVNPIKETKKPQIFRKRFAVFVGKEYLNQKGFFNKSWNYFISGDDKITVLGNVVNPILYKVKAWTSAFS